MLVSGPMGICPDVSEACVKAVQQREVPFQQAGLEQLDIHGQKVKLDLHLMLI